MLGGTTLTRTGTATVEGRFTVPEVWVSCDYHARHPKSGKLMRDLFKALPGARWNKTRNQWLLTGTPSNPDQWFHDAGIEVTIDQTCHPGVTSLQELYTPMSMLAPNGRQVLIRHRLAGFVATGFLLGWAATWDRAEGMYKIPVTDVYQNGSPRPGVLWDQESVQAAYDALTTTVSTPGWEQLAADFSRAVSVDPDYLEQVGEALAKFPDWWDREPFPFQTPGAYAALLGHRLIADAPGLGKAQPLSSLVLTPTGFVTMGSLKVGDTLVSPDGTPTQVEAIFPQGVRDVYELTLEDGRTVRADGEHIWSVSTSSTRLRKIAVRHLTTVELMNDLTDGSGKKKWSIQAVTPVNLGEWSSTIDPYLLGLILGDGGLTKATTPTFTNADDEILEAVRELLKPHKVSPKQRSGSTIDYYLSKDEGRQGATTPLISELRRIGIHGCHSRDKFVPSQLLHSGVADRHALLQGLLDTDGSPAGGSGCLVEFSSASKQLASDVSWLARSLGGRCNTAEKVVNGTIYYRLTLRLPDRFAPFRLRRKLQQSLESVHRNCNEQYTVKDVRYVGKEEVQCIRVASDLHEYVTDGFVRTHNTLQSIATAALQGAERILISCPPLLAVNWGREFEKCGYPGDVAVFRAGRKTPAFPEAGVVVIPDSLLTNRPELRQQVIDWAPQYFSVDEAHRMKNWDSKRSQAMLDVAASVRKNGGICVPLTGTPIISGPHELVPILEFAGLLGPVFGGSDAFLQRFCTKDPFGKFKPRMGNLGELNMLLTQHCWVRREKGRVLPWLPKRTLSAVQLEVDTKPYREAHEEVMVAIGEWMDQFREEWGSLPDDEAIDDFAANSLGLVSQLRVASAVCKIPAATEMIAEHLAADPENEFPLVVWVHHAEVANAIAEQMEELEVPYGMIVGGVSDKKRNEAVDQYQAGELRVMIASLTAAGVGVTLTRGCDALFVETDWTPANVTQAIDRQHRIGQERPVLARTLIAMNTLDERIQKIQHIKQTVAGKVTGDDQANVALLTQQGLVTPQEIIKELAANVLAARKKALA